MSQFSPTDLARLLRQHTPTAQQAAVIGAPPGPMLVVAGAGAGKTETMAARVVWLVANGHVRPDEVLGLTFTRKAARELGQRIRKRLLQLAHSKAFLAAADDSVKEALQSIAPQVATYDAYAGDLVSNYGLLLPTEPQADVLDSATLWQLANNVVREQRHIATEATIDTLTKKLIELSGGIEAQLADIDSVRAATKAFIANIESTPAKRQNAPMSQELRKIVAAQKDRLALLSLVDELYGTIDAEGTRTFTRQMALAARLAVEIPEVGATERQYHRVVMLDEYQDTSHAQRLLLRALYAGAPVTAVGDPMQAIYGWRGATAGNLTQFPEDFPTQAGQPAPTLQLTTSWRNPPEVLEMANEVADRAFAGRTRTVDPLQPRPNAEAGSVELALHADIDAELDWLSGVLAEEYQRATQAGEELSAAVLVRRNKDCAPIAQALAAAGVPYEIVGVGGLLGLPEIIDVISYLQVLVDPAHNEAMLRILTGPRWRLGAKDIDTLNRRAKQLTSYSTAFIDRADPEAEPLRRLIDDLDAIAQEADEPAAGLGHAVADPDFAGMDYSDSGAARIAELGRSLRSLRRWSLRKPLPDIIADVEEEFGIRVQTATADESRTVHLDRLADVAADYSRRKGGDLAGFLGYLELAEAHDRGLTPGQVRVAGNRVEILTVHKAKGLEWDVVAVPHVCAAVYDAPRPMAWPTAAELLPTELDGTAPLDGAPELDLSEVEYQSDITKAVKAYREELKDIERSESDRLFYVAVTRSARKLFVSAAHRINRAKKAPDGPSEHLLGLYRAFPDAASTWVTEAPEDPLPQTHADGVVWPHDPIADTRDELTEAAAEVRAAIEGHTAEPLAGDISAVWADDVTLVLEERARRSSDVIDVAAPVQMSTSEVQAQCDDPRGFARRRLRPVPHKPSPYARRGTAFHAWLEHRMGATAVIDETELAEIAGMDVTDERTLQQLKEAFLNSQWADRVPEYVEVPFDIGLGGRRIIGRIDAVFRIDGQWVIVDWKTGRAPSGAAARRAALQLAIYRQAWVQVRADAGEFLEPEDVRAVFHYVGEGLTVEPDELPSTIELAATVRISADEVDPAAGEGKEHGVGTA
ncbi:DEAD/DEAH box helicase [Corynebacterium sp. TAE3-ERU12]|uniref:UvrD-helicase domain-containing protein n=1 Tax=Corynebacterium sp. TAE3-ERU12 TaxID=2849491 RepID=UPI001C4775F5|nr:UvrD-helicase domain-containing protein [Corynebacterium sp. TAE3-ERU12]MBV7294843.1 DEAD/DEAH box helicase [Corynebacterium sp. TAE3-ERU12]